ncbi:MAG: TolC family protein [Gemmatimonadales bacterium]
MIATLLTVFQLAVPAAVSAASVPQGPDSLMVVTLADALRRAANVDPNYVAALRNVVDAKWQQRAAYAAFIIPATTLSVTQTRSNNQVFNFGTGDFANRLTQAQIDMRLNLFNGLSKFFEAGRAGAAVAAADANELQARFQTALLTEADYYDVLAQRELMRVAAERVRRAEEQFAIARARVLGGAAVQTDSLQLLLELMRAQVDLLRQRATLRVARIELGRRIGVPGPVDAAPLDTLPSGPLPITERQAVLEALQEGPRYRAAQEGAQAAARAYSVVMGQYLPRVDLFATYQAFGDEFFLPNDLKRWIYGFSINFPIWNNGQREIQLSQAKSNREVARALRDDIEREVRRDVVAAYEVFETARASADLAEVAVVVARENMRVNEERYRVGATTILDLLTAQVSLVEAEATLVQASQAERLALAGLEALLGRRIYPK